MNKNDLCEYVMVVFFRFDTWYNCICQFWITIESFLLGSRVAQEMQMNHCTNLIVFIDEIGFKPRPRVWTTLVINFWSNTFNVLCKDLKYKIAKYQRHLNQQNCFSSSSTAKIYYLCENINCNTNKLTELRAHLLTTNINCG